MAAHRYWRIYYSLTSGYVSAGEIQMRTTSGGSSVITGGTPYASVASDGAASNACDGNLFTKWGTFASSYPQWWAYDFGSGNDKDIVEIALTSRSDGFSNETGNSFTLQYSDDNSTWVDAGPAWTGVTWSSSSQTQVFTLPSPPPAGLYAAKVDAYAVLTPPPAGLYLSKANAFTVLSTAPAGVYVSKANAFTVLSTAAAGIYVSKTNAYAVLLGPPVCERTNGHPAIFVSAQGTPYAACLAHPAVWADVSPEIPVIGTADLRQGVQITAHALDFSAYSSCLVKGWATADGRNTVVGANSTVGCHGRPFINALPPADWTNPECLEGDLPGAVLTSRNYVF